MRNFLPAFGAPGGLIISLLLPGGSYYLFKIRFLVFFPSFAKLRARRRGPEYFFPPSSPSATFRSTLFCDLLPWLNFASHILFRLGGECLLWQWGLFTIQVKLEFGNVGFLWREDNRRTQRKTLGASLKKARANNKLNPQMTRGPGVVYYCSFRA